MNKISKAQNQLPENSPPNLPEPSRKEQLQKEAQHYKALIQADLTDLAIKSAKVAAVVGSTYLALRMMGLGRRKKNKEPLQDQQNSVSQKIVAIPPPPPAPKKSGLWRMIKNKAFTLVLEIISDKVQQSITKPQNKNAE